MPSSTTITTLLIFVHLITLVHGNDPLSYKCDPFDDFPPEGTYETSLHYLLADLSRDVAPSGFAKGSRGKGNDTVHGLALCRGDKPHDECGDCTHRAAKEIRALCGYNKTAIIWYDSCLLKYSGRDFFGAIDLLHRFALSNVQTLTESMSFVARTNKFLSELAAKAVSSPRLYAAGVSEACEYLTLNGFAQCTRDLSSEDCKQCLDFAVGAMPYVSAGKQGGRVVFASCAVRYEIYPIAGTQN